MTIPGPVCEVCRERQWAWIESNPRRVLPRMSIVSHATYDTTAAGVAENRRALHQRWRALVHEQITGIAEDCRRAGHLSTEPG